MTITTSAAPPILDALTGLYAFKEPEDVASFLEAHPFLVPLLIEARPIIARYFPDAPVVLELVHEPDAEDEDGAAELTELFATVQNRLPPEEAMPRLDRLDDDWWHANLRRGDGRLHIGLTYLKPAPSSHDAVRLG